MSIIIRDYMYAACQLIGSETRNSVISRYKVSGSWSHASHHNNNNHHPLFLLLIIAVQIRLISVEVESVQIQFQPFGPGFFLQDTIIRIVEHESVTM